MRCPLFLSADERPDWVRASRLPAMRHPVWVRHTWRHGIVTGHLPEPRRGLRQPGSNTGTCYLSRAPNFFSITMFLVLCNKSNTSIISFENSTSSDLPRYFFVLRNTISHECCIALAVNSVGLRCINQNTLRTIVKCCPSPHAHCVSYIRHKSCQPRLLPHLKEESPWPVTNTSKSRA